MFASSVLLVALAATPTGPTIQLNAGQFEVVGLAAADLERLGQADWTPDAWQRLFAVHVVQDARDGDPRPAVLGSYRVADRTLRFVPRFPVVPGVRYRAVFRPTHLPGHTGGEDVHAEFRVPRPKSAATVVTHVYPTRDTLPENQLKFYLHFSAPMSRGDSYRHLHLLDEKGKAVDLPFLELDEELWDPEGKRFTLLFDPGRIKRGLKPREEVGPALVEGKHYTLVIDRKWEDAHGNPLQDAYRKSFRVVAPDDTPPDPKHWRIEPPAADTRAPLTVTFRKPLDHALLQRLLWVTATAGKRVDGTIRVTGEETCWQFTPREPWRLGRYSLVVDTALEDLAGNRIGRPFEVDLFRPIQRELKTTTVRRSFSVK